MKEKKLLTIGISCAISLVLIIGFLIYVFAVDGAEDIFDSNYKQETIVKKKNKKSDNELSFTAETYEIGKSKDVNMSEYLQCTGMELSDVEWSSSSEEMYVGSDGHVSINENGITCTLVANSKSDPEVKAECIVRTRSEKDDFVYEVKSLNGGVSKDEALGDGVVQIAYDRENAQLIDLNVMEHEPQARNENYVWDKSLFYTLEEINPDSEQDGKINSYVEEKKKFINKETNNEIEYEIYRNPNTDKINKIVSIEYQEKKLGIVEYYYTDDGLVNFVYSYEDANYTPSYATPNRAGERYLFDSDTLVTWRIVKDGKQTNYCVGSKEKNRLLEGSHRDVTVYADCSKDIKEAYDEKEKQILNAAYNTWDKIMENEGVSTINGFLTDGGNHGIGEADVKLKSLEYDCELYTVPTDENGYYEIMVPTRNTDYSIAFNKDTYMEENVCEINSTLDEINLTQETVYLSQEDENEYNCIITFFDALNKASDEEGMAPLEDLDLYIRRGVNNRKGETVYETHVSDSLEEVLLKPGMYTVQMTKSGYSDSYSSLFVSADTSNNLEIYATPELADDEYRIVLTWNSDPNDLDSHLFIPTTGVSEDDYHVCFYNMEDNLGNTGLDVDDTDGYGPETTTIRHIQKGQYKFYVCDYTDCSEGNEESYRMSNSAATVRVYGKHGLIQTFHVPVNQKGVIWEVFEIRDGKIISSQRYYDSIGDKTWWQIDK